MMWLKIILGGIAVAIVTALVIVISIIERW